MTTDDSVSTFDEYLAKYRPDEFDKQRLDAMTPEERTREDIRRAVRELLPPVIRDESQPEPTDGSVTGTDANAPSEQEG